MGLGSIGLDLLAIMCLVCRVLDFEKNPIMTLNSMWVFRWWLGDGISSRKRKDERETRMLMWGFFLSLSFKLQIWLFSAN
jgi:hypothetical protein